MEMKKAEKKAKLIANASEGIVIEGKNSVTIENTELINENTANKNIDYNGYKLYVNGIAIN